MHIEVKHPCIEHKLAEVRSNDQPISKFRELISEITMLLSFRALEDLEQKEVEIETPIAKTICKKIKGEIIVVPILRAGLGMLDGFLSVMPSSKVGFLGMFRNEETSLPESYYENIPRGSQDDVHLIVDPMLATGGSTIAAIDLLKNWNLRTDFDNRAAALAILTFPLTFDIANYKNDTKKITKRLKDSILKLKSNYGRFDVPLGEVQRLVRGDVDLPLDGGPGNMRAIYSTWENGKMVAKVGDCFVQIVEWDPEGNVKSESIHQYGSNTSDSSSPFFNNQSKIFSEKKMKPVYFNFDDIINNLHSKYEISSN